MKFKAQVRFATGQKDPAGDPDGWWWETYDKAEITSVVDAEDWITDTVKRFNATLRRGERPRETSGKIEVIGESARQHEWRKISLTTQVDYRGNFDNMKCDVCGCTGRRYGLGQAGIKRSPQFKAKKWNACPG